MAAAERMPQLIISRLLGRQARRRLLMHTLLALLPISILWVLPHYSSTVAMIASVGIVLMAGLVSTLQQRRFRQRIWQQLNDLEPALQDSAELLGDAGTADSSLVLLQQRRIAAVLERQQQVLAERLVAVVRRPIIAGTVLLSLLLLLLPLVLLSTSLRGDAEAPASASAAAPVPTMPSVRITVTPPAYTGLPVAEYGAGDVDVPDGSEVRFCVEPLASAADIEVHWLDGEKREGDGVNAWCTQWTAALSNGYQVRWHDQPLPNGQGRLLLVTDAPPAINIRLPEKENQEIDSRSHVLELDIEIADDYGVTAANISWTLARGGGENVRFSGREQRLSIGNNLRQFRHQQRIAVNTLGMVPGDELYFHVTAIDNHQPNRQQTRSRIYVLRHPVEDAAIEGGARIPADLGKAKFRSQRQIILDTEALLRAKPQLDAATFRQHSEKLAQDQMILRLRYGEFLGEDSSFESATPESEAGHEEEGHAGSGHAEAGHAGSGQQQGSFGGAMSTSSVVAQFGHAHDESENATLFDEATKTILRRALQAMWTSEGALRMSEPAKALPAEYEALDAIKALQQADRIYLHKTAFTPPPLEESMRFSGDMTGAHSVQRAHIPLAASEQQHVVALLTALSNAGGTPAQQVELQTLLQSKLSSRDSDERGQALQALAELQALTAGCHDCAARLRDALLPQLTPPLPLPQSRVDPAARWHAALQDLPDEAPSTREKANESGSSP